MKTSLFAILICCIAVVHPLHIELRSVNNTQISISGNKIVTFDPKKSSIKLSKNTVFLIDGSSFLYRAYYSLRPLHTSKGVPVQAVYSFCRMIKKLIDKFKVENVVLVWDSRGKTTRHEMYESYKATRQAPPSDLFEQKEYIVKFADMIGMRQAATKGIEADDIMYSIGIERKKEGQSVCVITGDKDMAQMLDDQTVIYDPFKDIIIDTNYFVEKNKFPVEKLPFFYAILGDASDNIPGVKGIGEKGALELVTQFASLDDVYEHLDRVHKPKMRTLLQEQKDNAFLSQKLFLLQYHPSGLSSEEIKFCKTNWAQALPLFEELEFKSLIKEVHQEQGMQTSFIEAKIDGLKSYDFRLVTSQEELKELLRDLKQHKVFAVDTETTGLDTTTADLVGVSIAWQEGVSYYIPCGHRVEGPQLTHEEVVSALKPILEDPIYKKYMHSAKFDELVFKTAGINVQGLVFDTIIAARLIAKDWQKISLKTLSEYYLGEPMLSYDEVVKANKYKNFSYVPLGLATQYAAADAHQTLRLKKIFEHELRKEKLYELFENVEMPLIHVLYDMEVEGIPCDKAILEKLNKEVSAELATLEKQILGFVGHEYQEINLNSPKQIGELLFDHLKLPPQKKSGSGESYSTDVDVLRELSTLHPVPGLIIKYRELTKLKSTYIEALPDYIDKDGRIHTSFNQTAVATGRLASSDPNLQNIPTGGGFGGEIRAAFKPKPGHVFLSADYSQIELRVLAQVSQDKNLMNAFLGGHDVHAETAALLFDEPLNRVTNEQRQIGKRINFSILYGLTPFGLSQDLGIPFKDAKLYIEKYFAQYPGVSVWMESTVDDCKKKGYVSTWWGRRRYVPGIYEKNKSLYELAKRVAINTVAQGTAADIMKIGMIQLDKALKEQKLDAQMVLQIHDELLISVKTEQAEQVQILVKQILENVVSWSIPLQVTTRIGDSWKEVSK